MFVNMVLWSHTNTRQDKDLTKLSTMSYGNSASYRKATSHQSVVFSAVLVKANQGQSPGHGWNTRKALLLLGFCTRVAGVSGEILSNHLKRVEYVSLNYPIPRSISSSTSPPFPLGHPFVSKASKQISQAPTWPQLIDQGLRHLAWPTMPSRRPRHHQSCFRPTWLTPL